MARINASDLRAGMVLAEDAAGANGRLLLPKGTVLEDKHIRVLKIWGAVDADISDVDPSEVRAASISALDEESVELATAYVDALFVHVDLTRPPMAEMRSACIKHHARRVIEGEILPLENLHWETIATPEDLPRMDLQTFVDSDKGLASFPDIYFRINKALEDPASTAHRLAEVISMDPSISAKLLTLVNSPFYGFSQRIDSLSRGVAMVGARELSQLALGVAVMDLFTGIPDGIITVRGFWQHCIACGVLARILATHLPGIQQERCFVMGLLHDIGRLVMLKLAPQEIAWAINESRRRAIPLYEAEQLVFGFNHADVGGALFQRWNLPDELRLAVEEHHASRRPTMQESSICALADALAVGMGHGVNGTVNVPPLPDHVWAALGLPESVIEATMMAAARQIDDILTVFLK